MATELEFDWLEVSAPDGENLHDSGYRNIQIVGVRRQEKTGPESSILWRTQLHTNADHIVLEGHFNIDVTEEGVTRIMPWYSAAIPKVVFNHAGFFGSDAEFTNERRQP